jgi:hypothetical protein
VLSKKRAPQVEDQSTSRAIQQIYDDMNELIEAVNTAGHSASSKAKGKEGDTRTVKKGDGKMTYQIRTELGWSEPEGVEYKLVDGE